MATFGFNQLGKCWNHVLSAYGTVDSYFKKCDTRIAESPPKRAWLDFSEKLFLGSVPRRVFFKDGGFLPLKIGRGVDKMSSDGGLPFLDMG